MENIVKNRSEIIFCYDIKDANPNGDPLDSNKPRIDEETGFNLVTDVRLKRTIRDYLFNYKGYDATDEKDIFVRETESEKGGLKDGKARAKVFGENADKIIEKCIDIRMFGGVIPLEKKKKDKKAKEETEDNEGTNEGSITFTGPIQFQMGRSMHKVNPSYIKGTGAFASTEGKSQNTFREEHMLSYSFINFYGIVNENAAKYTKLTNEDVNLLIEGMWEGTKNLISRSKFGQLPKLLIKVNYNMSGFYIGDINKAIKINSDKADEVIRGIEDFAIDVTELKRLLEKYKDKIDNVEYKTDDRMSFMKDGEKFEIENLLSGKMTEIKY